jgi:predicted dehydrogenase
MDRRRVLQGLGTTAALGLTQLNPVSGFAATLVHSAAQSSSGKVGFAVIGLGVISKAFMEQTASSQTMEVVAFVTGHPDKAKEWAQKYNVPNAKIYTYETAHEMKSNPAIQAVYIGTPNAIHKRDVLYSAKAGKHVLCEKPMATNPQDCREMIAACKAANVKLMIAYRMQYEPLFVKAKEMISSGALGKIAAFQGAFGFSSQPNIWRLNKQMAGGGPLVDVGIYPLNAIRFLTGEEPVSYTAVAGTTDTTSGRFKEVEESFVWTMKMAGGSVASCATTYGAPMPGSLKIHGEKGMLEFQRAFENGGIHLTGFANGGRIDETSPREASQLRLEAEHMVDCIKNNTTPRSPGEEGLKDELIITELYKLAGIKA